MNTAPNSAGIASLPMYDLPEVQHHWDTLWSCIAIALREAGIGAPETLDRFIGLAEGWLSPHLVLGQTCGLPYIRGLRGRVALVGTPDFGVPDCPAGWYRSAIVVRADDPRDALRAFRGRTLAVNGSDSQSGAQAMMFHIRDFTAPHFGDVILTGSHEASARAVADGRADIAAIDHTTWRLLGRYRQVADDLRVMDLTAPTPALPLIAAHGSDPATRDAVAAGIDAAPAQTCATLSLEGFVPSLPDDYDLIAERDKAVRRISIAHGL